MLVGEEEAKTRPQLWVRSRPQGGGAESECSGER